MALMKTIGDSVTLVNATGDPAGLSAFYEGGDNIFEISEQGVNACAMWVLDPDGEFEVLAPAFDDALAWAEPTDGTTVLVHAYGTGVKRGRLCPAGTAGATALPIARLIKVVSATKIVIGGLQARTA
jgi:hypothetical protein